MVKKIKLTQGKFALVDDEDYEELNNFKWYCYRATKNTWYVQRKTSRKLGKQKTIKIHREILKAKPGEEVDHINGDGLDNRRCNLRICNHAENCRNRRMSKKNSSGLKGVSWNKKLGKWQAHIKINYHSVYIGIFDDKTDAYVAYIKKAKEFFGDYVPLGLL